ncbi:hypothetical protein [Roseateles microcysteis]|uniref:hypothetical protein n=1 Tax=Roseateles microcysteis TaxID=3119057 RepID=UPI002FE569AC
MRREFKASLGTLTVGAGEPQARAGEVRIEGRAGLFTHAMYITAEQAREIAQALIEAAAEATK